MPVLPTGARRSRSVRRGLRGRSGRVALVASACLVAAAFAVVPTASAGATPGDPTMQVSVTSVQAVAAGSALVVRGTTSCATKTDDQTRLVVSQAAQTRVVSLQAAVPDVTCDGRAHPWEAQV